MATVEQVRQTATFPPVQHIVLRGVPWQTYVALRDIPENWHVRMTYDGGVLEMMSPGKRHENHAELLGALVRAFAEELDIDIQGCRTMTFKREDLEKGLEPDNCYYIQHEAQVRAKDEIDFSADPPPDLAIEIDVTTKSVGKMPIYAAFRVPEVWRYDGDRLEVLTLAASGEYEPRGESIALAGLPLAEVERILKKGRTASEIKLVRAFRRWVREHCLTSEP